MDLSLPLETYECGMCRVPLAINAEINGNKGSNRTNRLNQNLEDLQATNATENITMKEKVK
ncbi:hypothetical protein [Bacteroides acidifaciens]|uniref:hypothetical protein n=1 Tax=Bacteroides acidifaciens TaxID=85831 RepID=UPI003F694A7B